MSDALTAESTICLGELAVETHTHSSARSTALDVPDSKGLDLVADLNAAHALDALALLADEVAVAGPLVLPDVLFIRFIYDVEFGSHILQMAVAGTYTSGTFPVMLRKDELHVGLAGCPDSLGIRVDDHAFCDFFGAGRDETLKVLHLYHTDAAGRDLVDVLQVAESRDLDSYGCCGFQYGEAFRDERFPSVYSQFYHFVSLPPLKLPKPK